MFDLNEQIVKWRRNLAQSETIAGLDIDELEGHLREEIEQLTALKLSDEEAFLIAAHRLGSMDSLIEEYEKINRNVKFRHRLFWIATGVLGYFLFTYLADVFPIALSIISGETYSTDIVVFISSKIVLWILMIFLCYHLYQGHFDNLRIRQLLSSFKGKCIFFTGLCILIIMFVGVFLFIVVEIFSDFFITEMIIDNLDLEGLELVWEGLRLVWSVVLPVLLGMLLIKLRVKDSPYKVEA